MVSEKSGGVLLADFPKLPLPQNRIDELVLSSVDWAQAHGLVMRTREHKDRSDICQHAPFALLPTPFPRKLFEQAVNVQNLMAKLYHEIAYDFEFLIECHKDVVKTDAFTRGLIDILKKIRDEGLLQRKTLVIQRSDYMCHKDPFSCEYLLRQIEVNNIASSMGAHAERVTKMHRRTMAELGYDKETIEKAILKNEPIKMIAEALYKAWKLWPSSDAVVLVIVEDVNQNQIDQRHVEYALEDMGVPVDQIVRRTLSECDQCLTLSPERHLLLLGSQVAVVYFRAGYSPDNYPSEKEWSARLLIERSDAIKSPWIGLQVANTKKTQQVLAQDGVVERFIGHPREAAAIRATFAGIWAINDSSPITEKLVKSMSQDERGAHILMERIHPLVQENYLVRAMQPVKMSKVVSELGVYGYALGDRGLAEVRQGGHLLRTKGEDIDEGGVAVGAAVIDSPFLYELL
nr:Glutathione synthase domain containing protein [Haemonchus contortus]